MKKLLFLLVLFILPLQTHAALTDNLQGYWKFDESSGNAADATANANTLTNVNTATFGAGKLNNACTLASASSQRFSIANASQSADLKSAGPFSLSFWIKATDAFPADGPVVWMRASTGTSNGPYIQMATDAGNTTMYVRITPDAATTESIPSPARAMTTNFVNGTWYHIVVTVSFADDRVRFYQNGSQIGADMNPTSTTQRATDGVFDWGAYNAGASNFLNGSLDESGYWNRELTAAEVTTLYGGGTPPAYPFAESSGKNFFMFF